MTIQRNNSSFTPVRDTTVGSSNNVTFSESTDKPIEHAVAIKRFNGKGLEKKDFCEWDGSQGMWIFYPIASYEYDNDGIIEIKENEYVSDVCSHY